MAMDEYQSKRDFEKTPEPKPGAGEAKGNRFVVHRHEARNLHYDLRVEADGVLACWAVPKGFSYAPSDKRLAVRTEDHPLLYTDFEGVIPKGQYGAGTMKIWDEGEYEVRKAPSIAKALEKGELKLFLSGRRLRGEWHLVRTKGGEGKDWLLFKARDRYAGSGADLFGGADMSRALRKPLPRTMARMEPTPGFQAFSDAAWLFEPAFVGKRVLVWLQGGEAALRSREGDLAPRLPGLAKALSGVRAETAVLDGVVVALDAQGRQSEEALASVCAAAPGSAAPPSAVALYLFDVLYAEEWDLRKLALRERKSVLRALLPESGTLFLVDAVAERGEAFAQAALESGLVGIVAKKADSTYRAGPSDDWRLIDVHTSAKKPKATGARTRAPGADGGITITNPRKVYWPEQGYTKADLIGYYDRVANWILPYLKDRPLHMFRWPDGIRGKSFYQKQLPDGLPDWVETVNVAEDGEEPLYYITCGDRKTLLTLINLGSIDIHPWMSRKDTLDSPDWAFLDLDPKEAPFSSVVKVARALGKLLRGLGVEPYLKTSGSTGLHVCIPLKPGYTYTQSRMFCEAVARLIVRDNGDIATVERVVSQRRGKVYVDFLQNRREQTIVPPYVVRPVEAASVSMPLAWDELEEEFHLEDFTLITSPARVERTGDLFRTALSAPQDLAPAIEALGSYL